MDERNSCRAGLRAYLERSERKARTKARLSAISAQEQKWHRRRHDCLAQLRHADIKGGEVKLPRADEVGGLCMAWGTKQQQPLSQLR